MVIFSDHMQGILLAWATAILATISPGPSLLATMGTAMGAGRRLGVALGLGISCGSFTWGLLATLGLSTMLASSTAALGVVRLFGAFYLAFLGLKAFQAAVVGRNLQARAVAGHGPWNYFLRGWGIHLTNPKAVLAWTAMIALGTKPGTPSWAIAAILAGAISFAGAFYSLAAVAFSTPLIVRLYIRGQRTADTALGIFFLFAAWKLAV